MLHVLPPRMSHKSGFIIHVPVFLFQFLYFSPGTNICIVLNICRCSYHFVITGAHSYDVDYSSIYL